MRFRIPVVYLTAYSNIEILERAKITEPFGYILKPYEERELHVVIETGIYKHRMEAASRRGSSGSLPPFRASVTPWSPPMGWVKSPT